MTDHVWQKFSIEKVQIIIAFTNVAENLLQDGSESYTKSAKAFA